MIVGLLAVVLVVLLAHRIVRRKVHVQSGVRIENIRAQLMLESTNPREIERFLMDKEPYISDELTQQLIDRARELKSKHAEDEDWERRLRLSLQKRACTDGSEFTEVVVDDPPQMNLTRKE